MASNVPSKAQGGHSLSLQVLEMTDAVREKPPKPQLSFVWVFSILATLVAFLPALFAIGTRPAGSSYIGFEYNTDDHMVYAAWMRQAMDGHFLMDNRFTTLPQPGLTIHLYFFVLGLLAKIVGIPIAAAIGRAVFSVLFIHLVARLAKRLGFSEFGQKVALGLGVFGAGIGFLLWQSFGVDISNPEPSTLGSLLLGHLPIDVWQPEGFVFPSMLTNGLFMVSLCLIVYSFLCFLDAKESWRAVFPGFLAVGVLMNIHSYDVLTVALVMVGFLAAMLVRKQATGAWVGRAAIIGAGAVIPALWFVHVLQSDTVFQSRAATETYSANFRPVLAGYAIMVALGLASAVIRAKSEESPQRQKMRMAGVGLAALLFLGLAAMAGSAGSGFFLDKGTWAVVFLVALASVTLAADENPAWNLVFAWAVIGTIAIYFPGLFQRKLTMGLSVPWALLSAFLLDNLLGSAEKSRRLLFTSFTMVLICASSLRWLFRDIQFIKLDVSNTTRHPVFLNKDMRDILDILNKETGRTVVLALPGAKNPSVDATSHAPIPDEFESPVLPDIAPILSGLSGVYSYAGHWSETPDYEKRTADTYRFFLKTPIKSVPNVMTPAERAEFIAKNGVAYVVLPDPKLFSDSPQAANWIFRDSPLISPADLGDLVYQGNEFELVKLRH